MMPYEAYRLYQIERPKSPGEIRRADEQLGRLAESVTALLEGTVHSITARALSLLGHHRQPATTERPTARA